MNRTDNIDEMSIEQLRDELRGAWNRLRNVKAVIDDDYDRKKDDAPMRENVAGDVQMVIHDCIRKQTALSDKVYRRQPSEPGSYREARGILAWNEGDEPAEDSIRRSRGG